LKRQCLHFMALALLKHPKESTGIVTAIHSALANDASQVLGDSKKRDAKNSNLDLRTFNLLSRIHYALGGGNSEMLQLVSLGEKLDSLNPDGNLCVGWTMLDYCALKGKNEALVEKCVEHHLNSVLSIAESTPSLLKSATVDFDNRAAAWAKQGNPRFAKLLRSAGDQCRSKMNQ
jgi:hypothetical protein